MSESVETSPYEKFLIESIDENKKQVELLSATLQKAGMLRKRLLKARLVEINQNIQILSSDLEKYGHGLSWLREPAKERDEKAEKLGPVDVSAIVGQVKPASPPGIPRPAVAAPRPSSSVPATPRPSQPIGAKPSSVPLGTPRPSVNVGQPMSSQSKPPSVSSTPAAQPPPTQKIETSTAESSQTKEKKVQPNDNETGSQDAEKSSAETS